MTGGVGGTVASESALRSAGTILSRVRAPPPAPWPDGGPESLRSPCCGLAIYKKPKTTNAMTKEKYILTLSIWNMAEIVQVKNQKELLLIAILRIIDRGIKVSRNGVAIVTAEFGNDDREITLREYG
ncbi:hypothetical protein PoB_004916800 [Plakobranchus ocellatus]|uniref:CCDC81 HU domain-containing protein n=1 Tax=Plakobranchus ocellatus TaxID=259542 RepID=A0AAV4BV31_9GAST|nr:hypothetical protein PoB_004916800 [Plakobranchus ocellatus]